MKKRRTRINTILLAVDGSDQAMEAVRYVTEVFPPEVVLFHVQNELPGLYRDLEQNSLYRSKMPTIRKWASEQQKMVKVFMDKASGLLSAAGFADADVEVVIRKKQVSIVRDIHKETQHNEYSAVVVGRTGMSKAKDLFIDSVATKLVGNIKHIPLIIVGGKPVSRKILVAFDGSNGAMRGICCMGALLDENKCDVKICHIVKSLNFFQAGTNKLFLPKQETDWVEINKNRIAPFITEAKNRLCKVGFESDRLSAEILTVKTSRAASIVEQAKSGNYGTIIVGRRGLITFIEENIFGRISKKVLQMAEDMAVWVVC